MREAPGELYSEPFLVGLAKKSLQRVRVVSAVRRIRNVPGKLNFFRRLSYAISCNYCRLSLYPARNLSLFSKNKEGKNSYHNAPMIAIDVNKCDKELEVEHF